VHLGQDDLPLAEARALAGGRLLGCSTHSLAQARAAVASGADVIGFGPIFETRSKLRPDPCVGLEGLREVARAVSCPVVAIGGITLQQAGQVALAGATYAAAIGALCGAESPSEAARALHTALVAAS
jgi:thiamine-phosphate pyrophosphorylase